MQSMRAGGFTQDLKISLDLKIGGSPEQMAEGGPYFRSRHSAPGDGVVGGTSAGYWIQLQSDGQLRIKRLHPGAIVAFSAVPEKFDAAAFHHLEVEAKGELVSVSLDSKPILFDVGGSMRDSVPIPSTWDTATPRGFNRGATGIAFGCYRNRGMAGGQEARNIRVVAAGR
jgi:hypothetical protein